MELYREITLTELFEFITTNNFIDIYYQDRASKDLKRATTVDWKFKEFTEYKWFKREVIGNED